MQNITDWKYMYYNDLLDKTLTLRAKTLKCLYNKKLYVKSESYSKILRSVEVERFWERNNMYIAK